jgi:glycerophosphoryl diester phosphodiesterase
MAHLKMSLLLMLAAIAFLTCKITEKNRPAIARAGFDWQAHRGCRGLLPENSVPAFLHALEFPEVVTLELDLAISKDRQLIVSHEPWFNPSICLLPDGDSIPKKDEVRYLIYEKTVAEIKAFDCGSRGNTRFPQQQPQKTCKPTFRTVVEAVQTKYPGKAVRWNIEIKSEPAWDGIRTPPIADFVDLVVAEIKQLGIEKSCNLQSFDVRPLQILHQKEPQLVLSLLVENGRSFDYNIAQLGFLPQIYSPYYLVVSKKLVRQCHDRNIQLVPWTVNDVTAMRKLIRLGVDGIITDYPNKIKEVSI